MMAALLGAPTWSRNRSAREHYGGADEHQGEGEPEQRACLRAGVGERGGGPGPCVHVPKGCLAQDG